MYVCMCLTNAECMKPRVPDTTTWYIFICVFVCVFVCTQYIYIYIFWQHFFVDTNFIKHNRHFMSTYFLLDPFEFPYYLYICWFNLNYPVEETYNAPFWYKFNSQHLKNTFLTTCPTTQLRKILTDNTTILEHQNNKQNLQILEALHIRNMQPTLNRINFQTSANVLKCLYLLTLFIEFHSKANIIIFNGKDALT